MAGTDVGKIRIKIEADGDGLDRSIGNELDKAEGKVSGKVGAFAKRLGLAAGAAIGATAVKSIFDFTGFERQMNEVFTLMPGISGKAMQEMTGQVKEFSKEFGVLPDKVVPALYQALSAGVPPGNVFEFLETAQKAAKGGVTDLTTAVDGISSVVNAYGSEVISATQASDLMFTAVRLGKTNFEELSRSLFNVTPTTAALGVGFQDVTAALAAMTAQGVPTSVATTQLRQLFVELSKEGTKTSKVFQDIAGKGFKDFIAGGKTTQDALQLLETHAEKTGVGINDLFGSVEAGSAALALTGQGTKAFDAALAEMGMSAGATQAAFEQMDRGIGPMFDKLKARGAVALIDLGDAITNFAFQVVDGFTGVESAGHNLATTLGAGLRPVVDFVRDNATPILTGLAVVIGAALVPALHAAGAAVAAFFSPVVLIVGAVALLAAGFVYAYQHFEGFRSAVDGVVSFLTGTVLPAIGAFAGYVAEQFGNLVGFVRQHWGAIQEAIGHVVAAIQAIVGDFITGLIGAWRLWGDEITNIARIVWDQVRNTVETVINVVRGIIVTVLALINGDWGAAWDGIKSILSAAWNHIRSTIVNALSLAREAVEAGVSGIVALVGTVPGRILSALGDLGGLLYNAGRSIMEGLGRGIKDAAQGVFDFVSGIAGKIASLKGPLDYDRRLLIPAGQAIMDSLVQGLRDKEYELVRELARITAMIESINQVVAPVTDANAFRSGYMRGEDGSWIPNDPNHFAYKSNETYLVENPDGTWGESIPGPGAPPPVHTTIVVNDKVIAEAVSQGQYKNRLR